MNARLAAVAAPLILAVSASTPALAQPTCELPIYAYVTDDVGAGLAGSLDVELRFYTDASVDAEPAECRSLAAVPVDDGWLRMVVDICGTPAPGDCGVAPLTEVIEASEMLAVGIAVGGSATELSPRIQVGTAPYAVRATDAATLEGLGPDAFEAAGEVAAHAADEHGHHSATSDGIAITPSSVEIGATRLDDGRLDLGADADDELTAEIVQTLTGGGDADALHSHSGSHDTGGSCYISWGEAVCFDGWTAVYDGIGLALDSNLSREAAALYCIRDTAVTESSDIGRYYRLLGPVSVADEGDYRPDAGELACAVCCR